MSAQWETVLAPSKGDTLERTRVAGGYLYRTVVFSHTGSISVALTFVPDLPRGHGLEIVR
jgi:hypothetical protein